MKEMSFSEAVDSILAGRLVEFPYHDAAYLIQRENNKGYNYLSIWRAAPDYVCLDRVFFDIEDGLDEEIVRELLRRKCIEGRSAEEILLRENNQEGMDMNSSRNKQLVIGLFEDFFNAHDISSADRYLHPDYIQHDFDVPPGVEGFKEHFTHVFEIFPDFHVDVRHLIEEGDMIVMHGYGKTDPGRIEVLVADTYRVRDGLLYEHWGTVQPLPPEQFGNPDII